MERLTNLRVMYCGRLGLFKKRHRQLGIYCRHLLTSTSPCRILTNMTSTKCTLHAPGISRFRKADIAMAPPNILKCQANGRTLAHYGPRVNIESSPVWDTSCLVELFYDAINKQFLCGKCSKPVTIEYLPNDRPHGPVERLDRGR